VTRKTYHFDARSRQSAIFEASVLIIVRYCLTLHCSVYRRQQFMISFISYDKFDNID